MCVRAQHAVMLRAAGLDNWRARLQLTVGRSQRRRRDRAVKRLAFSAASPIDAPSALRRELRRPHRLERTTPRASTPPSTACRPTSYNGTFSFWKACGQTGGNGGAFNNFNCDCAKDPSGFCEECFRWWMAGTVGTLVDLNALVPAHRSSSLTLAVVDAMLLRSPYGAVRAVVGVHRRLPVVRAHVAAGGAVEGQRDFARRRGGGDLRPDVVVRRRRVRRHRLALPRRRPAEECDHGARGDAGGGAARGGVRRGGAAAAGRRVRRPRARCGRGSSRRRCCRRTTSSSTT